MTSSSLRGVVTVVVHDSRVRAEVGVHAIERAGQRFRTRVAVVVVRTGEIMTSRVISSWRTWPDWACALPDAG